MGDVVPVTQCIVPPSLAYSCCQGAPVLSIVQTAENSLLVTAKGAFSPSAPLPENWSVLAATILQPCLIVYNVVLVAPNQVALLLTQELSHNATYLLLAPVVTVDMEGLLSKGVSQNFTALPWISSAKKQNVPLLDFDMPIARKGALIANVIENDADFGLAGGNATIKKVVAAILSGEYFRLKGQPVPYSYKELMSPGLTMAVFEQEIAAIPYVQDVEVIVTPNHSADAVLLTATVTTTVGTFIQESVTKDG